MRAVAVVLGLCTLAAPAAADRRADRLFELGRVTGKGRTPRVVVDVRGELPRTGGRGRAAMVGLVSQVVADVERRFLDDRGDPHPAIQLCLFSDPARYTAFAGEYGSIPSSMGFYMPDVRVGIANVGNSIGNVRHELVHPLIGDDFPKVPAWMNEGLGALYGTAKWTHGKFVFLVNYRLRDLQRALRAGTLPTLAELSTTTFDDVHGERAGMYYAYGRYLLLYLDRHGTLSQFYADMRDGGGDPATQRKLFARYVDERAFRTWARGLRY